MHKTEVTQKLFPFITDDFRIIGFSTNKTDDVFVYENLDDMHKTLKGLDLKRYLTYKRMDIDLGDLGVVTLYRQAIMPSNEVELEMKKFFINCNYKNRVQLISSLNVVDPEKLI